MPPGVYSADDFAANCQSPATSPGHCPTPTEPGYYWAKWKIASPGTFENDDFKPSNQWETVEVWFNGDVPDHPEERLGVSVPGVRETQWVDQFYWGPRINPPT